MNNIPEVKVGIVAVSRDCFPESLSVNRRKALVDAYKAKSTMQGISMSVRSASWRVRSIWSRHWRMSGRRGCNALVVYLGNFGPEISETLLAKHFDGPKMFVAAAEESKDNLVQGRGDAYCGMLNASYNLALRNIKAYIPEYPVGTADECADMIHEFVTDCESCRRPVGFKDHQLWPKTVKFPGMQCADQAALQSGCGD